jgi:hypothetical protein
VIDRKPLLEVAVNDADVAYIIATRPSLGQTDKDYNG